MTVDLESEQFQTLLTDALRSGPGSPEWHQAVRTLRQSASSGSSDAASAIVDEYTLLCTARERLESGKSYRSVRAGPEFTRKVMEQVSSGEDSGGRATSTGILLFLAGLVIVAAIVAGAIILLRGRSNPPENLANIYFSTPVIPEAHFDTSGPANMEPVIPAGWRQFGDLPLMTNGGLCPNPKAAAAPAATVQATTEQNIERHIGGIVGTASLPADQPFDVDLTFKVLNSDKDFIAQAFVSDEPIGGANGGQGAGSHEVVFQLAAAEGNVFLAGRAEPNSCRLAAGKPVLVRILVDRENVIVEAAGQRLYSGSHQLATDRPRYVGLRFLRLDKPQQNGHDNGRDIPRISSTLLSIIVRKP